MTTLQQRLAQIKTGYTPPGPSGFTLADLLLLLVALSPATIVLISLVWGQS